MIYSIQGVVFVGVFPAIAALVMANAAFRRHRAFALRVEPQGRLAASRFNHISQGVGM